jgi:hypothetical protein
MQYLRLSRFSFFGGVVFTLLLAGCVFEPSGESPGAVRLFYYPQSQTLCPQGVLVTGKLSETDPRTLFHAINFVTWDKDQLGEIKTSAVDQEQTELLRDKGAKETSFRLTKLAVAPTQNEALTRIPENKNGSWDGYYQIGYMRTKALVNPTVSVKCLADKPAITITVPANGNDVLVVIEDPSATAKLRLTLSPVQ